MLKSFGYSGTWTTHPSKDFRPRLSSVANPSVQTTGPCIRTKSKTVSMMAIGITTGGMKYAFTVFHEEKEPVSIGERDMVVLHMYGRSN
jgi:hypothetical protein